MSQNEEKIKLIRKLAEQILSECDSILSTPEKALAAPALATKAPTTKLDEIKARFPKELGDMLIFSERDDVIIIKPRQFLGPESFAKIASIIRSLGGDYVSAGRDSHFKILKS